MKIGPSPQNAKAGISACDICDHKTCSAKSALLYCLFVQGSQTLLVTERSEGRWAEISNLRTDGSSIRTPAHAAPPAPFQDRAVWNGNTRQHRGSSASRAKGIVLKSQFLLSWGFTPATKEEASFIYSIYCTLNKEEGERSGVGKGSHNLMP